MPTNSVLAGVRAEMGILCAKVLLDRGIGRAAHLVSGYACVLIVRTCLLLPVFFAIQILRVVFDNNGTARASNSIMKSAIGNVHLLCPPNSMDSFIHEAQQSRKANCEPGQYTDCRQGICLASLAWQARL